jgi:hypothetical protein
MTKHIWKYELNGTDVILELPLKSKILDVQFQKRIDDVVVPVLWAIVDDQWKTTEKRRIKVLLTGNEVRDANHFYDYLKTLQNSAGLVYHVFEVIGPDETKALT